MVREIHARPWVDPWRRDVHPSSGSPYLCYPASVGKTMTKSLGTILRRFERPDEVRTFTKGRLELVTIAQQTFGRATYEPGWKWSVDVGPGLGQQRCAVEHLGLVLAGHATAAFDDGRVFDLTAGTLFYIPPEPHDSWVVGNELYVSLHLMGAAGYAK